MTGGARRRAEGGRRWLAGAGLAMCLAGRALPAAAALGAWSEIGPEGGAVFGLAAAPGAPGTVYAFAESGFIFRSTDGAASWRPTGHLDGVFPTVLPEVSVDPFDSSVLYVPTGPFISKSADGGGSWSHLAVPGNAVNVIALPRTGPRTIYAAASTAAVYRSTDGGASWVTLPGPPNPIGGEIETLAVDAHDANRIYAGDLSSAYYSADAGMHWTRVAEPAIQGPDVLMADPSRPLTVYAMGIGFAFGPLWKSADGGVSWASVSQGLPEGNFGPAIPLGLAIAASGTVWVALDLGDGTPLLFSSPDAGATWQAGGPFPHQLTGLVADAGRRRLYAASLDGVWLSRDGAASWAPANHGFTPRSFSELVADGGAAGTLFGRSTQLIGLAAPLNTTTDGGATWNLHSDPQSLASPGGAVRRMAIDAQRGVLFVLSGNFFRSEGGADVFTTADRGGSWRYAGSQVFELNPTLDLAYSAGGSALGVLYTLLAIPVECPDGGILVCFDYELYSSADQGGSWGLAGGWFQNSPTVQLPVGRLWADPADGATVYAAVTTAEGQSAFLRSADGGRSWTQLGLSSAVVDLAFDPRSAGRLYAAVGGPRRQVVTSGDGGTSWQRAWVGLPHGAAVTALAFDDFGVATLYAATAAGGVYASTDGGASWQVAAPGLAGPGVPILCLAADGLGRLYAGADGGGVYGLRRRR